MIKFFSTRIGAEELDAMKRVIDSDWYGNGEETKRFEKEMSKKFGSPYVLYVNSCTSALYVALRCLNIGVGKEIIIPTIHFPGALNAILLCGLIPKYADVDRATLNILPSEITRLMSECTAAVMLLHYGGHSCPMNEIRDVSKGIHIIEDNANSPSSKYYGKNCGTMGDIGCWSFDAMKIMTTIDGGALTFNDKKLYEKAKVLRYFGFNSDSMSGFSAMRDGRGKWWDMDLEEESLRFISNDLLAGIGRVQLQKLDSFIAKRKEIWSRYQKEFEKLDWLMCPLEPLEGTESSYYLYWLTMEEKIRDIFAKYLIEKEIYCTFKYVPLHKMLYYSKNAGGKYCNLLNAEEISRTTLNIPIHQYLTEEELEHIIKSVKEFTP